MTGECERCGEPLNDATAVWLHLSNTDGRFYPGELPPGHISQGWFTFGKACARAVSKANGNNIRLKRFHF